MKIFNSITRNIKALTIATPLLMVSPLFAQKQIDKTPLFDIVQLSTYSKDSESIVPKGTTNPKVLSNAPNPTLVINEEIKKAKIVVRLSENALYQYNNEGKAVCAYLIASGKKSTPTDTGARIITHVETYPYKNAPRNSKRYKNPRDYGPKILVLRKLNLKTGETSPTGEFIHGNRNPNSLGKYASKGCIRMDNDIIRYLSKQIQKGDFVLIQN